MRESETGCEKVKQDARKQDRMRERETESESVTENETDCELDRERAREREREEISQTHVKGWFGKLNYSTY